MTQNLPTYFGYMGANLVSSIACSFPLSRFTASVKDDCSYVGGGKSKSQRLQELGLVDRGRAPKGIKPITTGSLKEGL